MEESVKTSRQYIALPLILLLASCTGPLIQTSLVNGTGEKRTSSVGLTYMLPTQPVQVKFTRSFEKSSDKPRADYDTAVADLKQAKSAVSTAQEARNAAQTAFDEMPDSKELEVELARAAAKHSRSKFSTNTASTKVQAETQNLLDA